MPTFVLVHGGGHGAWCWDRVKPLLEAAGHRVIAPTLVGVGERASERTAATGLSTHVEQIVKLIESEDLGEVILAGHSYGCMVISGVAGAIPAHIRELVFLDGPHPRDGECLLDASPGARVRLEPTVQVIDGVELVLFPTADTLDIYGIRTAGDIAFVGDKLTPHPWRTFTEPLRLLHPAAFAAIPRTSVDCLESGARRDPAMNARAAASERTFSIDTGHDLMISEPEATAAILLEVATDPLTQTRRR